MRNGQANTAVNPAEAEFMGGAPTADTAEVEPDWKAAFSGVIKQRNEWINRAQNLELDLFLLQEKMTTMKAELDALKADR